MHNDTKKGSGEFLNSRRKFVMTSAGIIAGLSYISPIGALAGELPVSSTAKNTASFNMEKSIIGGYGPWAATLAPNPPKLSFRNPQWSEISSWKREAIEKTRELLAAPDQGQLPDVKVEKKYVHDGLEVEEISWQLPYGRRTQAVVLRPVGVKKRLPGILALHDHGGKKYFGKAKITNTRGPIDPLITEHQTSDYEGMAWANEIARRGYVVLVHDTFAFGSRRVYYEDMNGINWGSLKSKGKVDKDIVTPQDIAAYNSWASDHENVMSKSLFCSGTTWPGVVLSEDQTALSVLANRSDVDPDRLGCGGLSGGGLRTVYLGGLDPRIKCAVCVGFMTTWNDLLLNKSFTHTWMTYAPLLPGLLDFPEILGLRVPLPVLVQNNNQDELYTLPEMKKADGILKEVYKKAGAEGKYEGKFYDGPHKFDLAMQKDAFGWFDQWLS